MWILIDVGCIECAEQTEVVGVYPTQEAAETAYDAAIVAAESATAASKIHPSGRIGNWIEDDRPSDWALPQEVSVIYLGEAPAWTPPGVILASFHAG
jgi:hypothetical protein